MTKYLLSVIGQADQGEYGTYQSEEEMRAARHATGVFNDGLRERGVLVFVDGLKGVHTATVVDARGDEPILTDGPYIESKEVLNGLWIIDVPDLDEALKIAAEASHVCGERLEVRPFASA